MYLLIILLLTFISTQSFSQQISEWHNYTAMKNIRSAAAANNLIWGATDGGAFSYNILDNSYKTYNKTDGLNGISITAVTIDKYGKIWFGSNSGIIDVFDPQTNSFKTILDIFNSDNNSKVINELIATGDTIMASTDFGVSLININNYFFFDTFFKFGNFPSFIRVNSTLKSRVIYACTNQGLAIQKTNATNLSAPESWNVYNTINGLPSDSLTKIISFKDTIVAATTKGLAFFNGSIWSVFLNQFTNSRVNDIIANGDSLIILSQNRNVSVYHNGVLNQIYTTTEYRLNKLSHSPEIGILITTSNGILRLTDGSFIYPDGPFANQFPNMAVDNNSVLWSASGKDNTGVGFYKYEGTEWTNYNRSSNPAAPTNAYYTVYPSSDGRVFLGSWGQGISVFENGEFTSYKENLDLLGTQRDPNFIVITGFAEDSKNNVWILSYGSSDRKLLSMSGDLQEWNSFTIPAVGNAYVDETFNLVIDQYDIKWFCVQRHRAGLFYFKEGTNPESTSDDVSGYLTVSSGLNNNFVSSIAVDRRGDVWVGTSLGVNIITNVNSILTGNPQLRISSVFSLRQQTVTAIVVDPLNQKWIGTNQGLTLVNSDGTSLLATFTTKNSPLLSDQITSLAMDENSGTIYVGTDQGLTSFKTTSIKPNETFDELFVYPNPFILNKKNDLITIEGLIRDTDIKILTISGKLVKEFSSPGGRVALWDGRDDFGDLVPSGVYFVIAFDQEGNNVSKTKIAVLRED